MKKLLSFLFLMNVTIVSLMAQTGSFTYSRPDGSSFNCVVTSDSTAKLTGGNVDSLNRLILPDTVYQDTIPYLLTEIDTGVFQWCDAKYISISNSVKVMRPNAFQNPLEAKDSITIGAGIEYLSDYNFWRLTLRKLIFNARNCTHIGDHCFTGRGGKWLLRELIIGDSVRSIPNRFMNLGSWAASNACRITIGPNVSYMGDSNIFLRYYPSQRAEFIMLGPPPTVSEHALDNAIANSIAIQVPCEYMSQYQSDSIWGNCNLVSFLPRIKLKAIRGTAEVTTPLSCTNNVATIVATPDAGYRFVGWSDGDTSATRNITVDRDTIIAARFEPILDSGDYAFFFDFDNPANDSLWVLPDSLNATWHIGRDPLNNIDGTRCLYVVGVRPPDGVASMGTGGGGGCTYGCGYWGVVHAYTRGNIHLPERTYIPHFDCNLCQTYYCNANDGIGISACPTVALVPDSALLPPSFNDHGGARELPESSIILENDNQVIIPEGAYKLVFRYEWSSLWDTIGASVDNIWLEIVDSVDITIASIYPHLLGAHLRNTQPAIRTGYNDTLFLIPPPIVQGNDSNYYHFRCWLDMTNSECCREGYSTCCSNLLDEEYSTDSLLQLVARRDYLLYAYYDPNVYTVSIDTTGLSPCMTIGEGPYDYGTRATVGITVGRGNFFAGWTNGTTNNPQTLQVFGDTTLHPIIHPAQVRLTNTSSGNVFARWSDGILDNPRTFENSYDTSLTVLYGSLPTSINCDFEDSADISLWSLANGDRINRWVIDTAIHNGGSRALYISDDGGASNHCASSGTAVFAYAEMFLDSGDYYYSYDWQMWGSRYHDQLRAALLPDSIHFAPSDNCYSGWGDLPFGAIALDNGGIQSYIVPWHTVSDTVTVPRQGVYRMVFSYRCLLWRYPYNPPAAVDNVVFQPLNVTISDTNYIHDTIFVYDTTIVIQYDTTFITQYIHDTVTESIVYYNLLVTSGNPSCGMAAGSGHFPEGTIVEIAAIPFSGNRFLQWDDGNSDNPRIVTLDGNSQFTALFDTEGINDVEASRWWLKSERGALIVEGAAGRTIKVYNMWGQLLHTYSQALNKVRFAVPAAGTYVVSVDDGPAKKITVIR